MDAPQDVDLLRRTRSDAAAFEVFYLRHVGGILSYLSRRVGAAAATDLTAEVFAVALQRAHAGRIPAEEPAHWLYGVARNLAAAYFRTGTIERRAQRRLGISRLDVGAEELERIEQLASLDVAAKVLNDALSDLPAEHRAAVVARVVHEQSYEEIGRDAQVSQAVARQRVSRGLASLRNLLGGQR